MAQFEQSSEKERIYRKGVRQGANAKEFDHRFEEVEGLRKKTMSPFANPKTPSRGQLKAMTSKDGQANVTKAAFRLGINNIERTKDMLKNKTSMRMTFRSNRNEMYRAQT